MPDGDIPQNVRTRDIWEQVESLRTETREARHAQNNATQVAIASLRTELDVRLRNIETTMAAANPTTMGPRLSVVEQWQAVATDRYADLRADVTIVMGEAATLKAWRDQMGGVVKALAIVATCSGILSGVLAVIAFAKP